VVSVVQGVEQACVGGWEGVKRAGTYYVGNGAWLHAYPFKVGLDRLPLGSMATMAASAAAGCKYPCRAKRVVSYE
jgi:hypothetical protein